MFTLKLVKIKLLLVFYIFILVISSLLFYFPKDVKAINNYKVDLGFTFTYLKINNGIPTIQYSYRINNISSNSVKGESYIINKDTNIISHMNFVEISGFLEDNTGIKIAGMLSDHNETRVFGGLECECFIINLVSNYESFIIDAKTGLWLQYETQFEKIVLISWDFETTWFNSKDFFLKKVELTQIPGLFLIIPCIFILFILYLYLDKKFFTSD